jgi:seryl-tRNA synthetase
VQDVTIQLPEPLPEALVDEFQKKLVYVAENVEASRYERADGSVRLRLRDGGVESRLVSERVLEIAAKLNSLGRMAAPRVLAAGRGPQSPNLTDPHSWLEANGELVRFAAGRYGLGPQLTRLVRALDTAMEAIASDMAAPPYQFPSLIAAEVLDRCRYLANFPASLNLVSHLREDLGLLQEFAKTAAWKDDALQYPASAAAPVDCLLSPSVCFHWYNWLRQSSLERPRSITALGKCFRYESSSLAGLERLWDFTMREIIFVGPEPFVLERRQACVEAASRLLDDLGLEYEIATATDPFFVDTFAVQAAFQHGFELKFELLCPLPYSGKKLAVGSINYHRDFFGRTFSIDHQGQPAHTGCIGFGLERLALAIAAQHGPAMPSWPAWIRERMEGGPRR